MCPSCLMHAQAHEGFSRSGWRGWSVNLTSSQYSEIELPVPILFTTSVGPVIELVFWSPVVERWIHGVSAPFARELPAGHVQVAAGDMAWLQYAARGTADGLRECVRELEANPVPED